MDYRRVAKGGVVGLLIVVGLCAGFQMLGRVVRDLLESLLAGLDGPDPESIVDEQSAQDSPDTRIVVADEYAITHGVRSWPRGA